MDSPLVRAAGKRVAVAAAALRHRWDEFEDALFNVPGATWDDSGIDDELLEAVRIFAGAPTTAERLYRQSVRETVKGGADRPAAGPVARDCAGPR